jgi:haloalkane dehalogenase
MNFVKTPDSHFENLLDYPFSAHYQKVGDGMQMHYVDEGEGEIVLLLHGEPSWSYLYRKMIPIFVNNGFRVIAPDLIGFGKSDKPTDRADYTYANHLRWLTNLIEKLALKDINLFCQDWGGLLGLRIVAKHAPLFSRVIASNTILPTGQGAPNEAFMQWRDFSQSVPEFPVSGVINMGTTSALSPEVLAAYDAPFPDESYKEGARIFPALVPITFDQAESANNREAWASLSQWNKPFLTLFSDSDPIMKGMENIFLKIIPGTKAQPHTIIENAGHFLQEDKGEELAELSVNFIKTT